MLNNLAPNHSLRIARDLAQGELMENGLDEGESLDVDVETDDSGTSISVKREKQGDE